MRQVRCFFHSEFSTECYLVLPLSVSSILTFPYGHSVAAYVFSLVFSSLLFLSRILWYLIPVTSLQSSGGWEHFCFDITWILEQNDVAKKGTRLTPNCPTTWVPVRGRQVYITWFLTSLTFQKVVSFTLRPLYSHFVLIMKARIVTCASFIITVILLGRPYGFVT